MGGSKYHPIANTRVGELWDEIRCVIMCIECALESFKCINTTHNNNNYVTPIVSNTHFHQHSCNAHNPNRISIISGTHEC